MSLATTLKDFVRRLSEEGRLPDQSRREYSKPINFYIGYQSSDGAFLEPLFRQLADEVGDHERRKNRRAEDVQARFLHAIRVLVLNTMHVRFLMGDNLYLAISRNRNDYGLEKRYAPKGIAYKPFIAAFDGLVDLGFISIHKEGYNDRKTGESFRTQIAASEKLIRLYEDYVSGRDITFIAQAADVRNIDETIILRSKDGRTVEYADTDFTDKARENISLINDVLSRHQCVLPLTTEEQSKLRKKVIENYAKELDGQQPFIDFQAHRLYRIFSDGSFTKGGRFYRGWWQNVPKTFRPFIIIDGQKTVEIDYSTFHPSILYAEQGLALEFDAYDFHPKVSRNIGKVAFNALLNAKGVPRQPLEFNEEEAGISWKAFLSLVKQKHKVLADDDIFLKGYGLEVQFHDSELAESIILHFAEKDIPCLPIHDSFIVQEAYADELEEVMLSKFKEQFGQTIRVERK